MKILEIAILNSRKHFLPKIEKEFREELKNRNTEIQMLKNKFSVIINQWLTLNQFRLHNTPSFSPEKRERENCCWQNHFLHSSFVGDSLLTRIVDIKQPKQIEVFISAIIDVFVFPSDEGRNQSEVIVTQSFFSSICMRDGGCNITKRIQYFFSWASI